MGNTMMVEAIGKHGAIHEFIHPEEVERMTIEDRMTIGETVEIELETMANALEMVANGLEITTNDLEITKKDLEIEIKIEIEIEDQFQEATNPEEVLIIEAADGTIRHQTARLYKPQYK